MKKNQIYKEFFWVWPDEFSHHCASWARNHNGWSKSKKANKKIAKRRMKHKQRMEDLYAEEADS